MSSGKNEIRYNNKVNHLVFAGFSERDYNVFFAICSKLQGCGTQRIQFTYKEIAALIGYKNPHMPVAKFSEDVLHRVNQKLMKMDYTVVDSEYRKHDFVFFPEFIRDDEAQTLTVHISPHAVYLFNQLNEGNWTCIELQQFVSIRSRYAKILYRCFRQFRSTGRYVVRVEDFRELLGIPDAYENKTVLRDIINPAIKALQPFFANLSCTPVKSRKQGSPVSGYIFTFRKEIYHSPRAVNAIHFPETIEEKAETPAVAPFHTAAEVPDPGGTNQSVPDVPYGQIYRGTYHPHFVNASDPRNIVQNRYDFGLLEQAVLQ